MWRKPLPAAMRDIDQEKVFDMLERRCSGCGCRHGINGLNIIGGQMSCRRCKCHRGSAAKTVAPRRRAPAWRPAVAHAVPRSAPRPRPHCSSPAGRDGSEARDDGGGGGDDDGGGGDGPPSRLGHDDPGGAP